MNKIIINIDNLKTDKKYSNYLLSTVNIDYLIYRSTFNKYLSTFLKKCIKYNIKLYNYDVKYNILNKNDIIEQINILKKNTIKSHINILSNLLDLDADINNYVNDYINVNNNIINKNNYRLKKYDSFIKLIDIIYNYKILELEDYKIQEINIETEYNNLVNLCNNSTNFSSAKLYFPLSLKCKSF
jgi:hypothetical protein